MLGLAFHPDYESNGRFFIYYTDRGGDTVVARYQVMPNQPDLADPASAQILFQLPQPYSNHNGGHIDFGADGYLYVALGDGGAANDPLGAGQNRRMLLGSILRLDVDFALPYAIPTDNPFVGDPAALDEIWAYGLRNVWRFSFDRATGDLYMADVGRTSGKRSISSRRIVLAARITAGISTRRIRFSLAGSRQIMSRRYMPTITRAAVL